jgi:hypothetical protein
MKLKEYRKAQKSLNKMLQFAWVGQSQMGESSAYDMLSLCHFYMGDLKRSSFYHTRFVCGITESRDSRVRCICTIPFKDAKTMVTGQATNF